MCAASMVDGRHIPGGDAATQPGRRLVGCGHNGVVSPRSLWQGRYLTHLILLKEVHGSHSSMHVWDLNDQLYTRYQGNQMVAQISNVCALCQPMSKASCYIQLMRHVTLYYW